MTVDLHKIIPCALGIIASPLFLPCHSAEDTVTLLDGFAPVSYLLHHSFWRGVLPAFILQRMKRTTIPIFHSRSFGFFTAHI